MTDLKLAKSMSSSAQIQDEIRSANYVSEAISIVKLLGAIALAALPFMVIPNGSNRQGGQQSLADVDKQHQIELRPNEEPDYNSQRLTIEEHIRFVRGNSAGGSHTEGRND